VIWRAILARHIDGKADCHLDDPMAYGGACCEIEGRWAHLTLAGWNEEQQSTITIRFIAADLDAFLEATARIVPYGSEVIDIDAGLAQLLGGAR
jgi:hypothetical protein